MDIRKFNDLRLWAVVDTVDSVVVYANIDKARAYDFLRRCLKDSSLIGVYPAQGHSFELVRFDVAGCYRASESGGAK